MKYVTTRVGKIFIARDYPDNDPILSLPPEKMIEQLVAECIKELAAEQVAPTGAPVTVRG